MADLTLTPEDVAEMVPGADVTARDITDAADHIAELTGHTVTEHSDEATDGIRLVRTNSVLRAWAIVAARLRFITQESTSGGVVAESVDGVSFTINPAELEKVRRDLLTGLPRDLLRLNHGVWGRVGETRRYTQQNRRTITADG